MSTPSRAGPGFGLGLRTPHYQDFLAAAQQVDWLEIITDNFLVAGGKPLQVLEKIRRDYPMAMHGVAMSIGSADGLDLPYLARVKQLARRLEPLWISDHLCWTGTAPHVLHDLFPMPYTDDSARLLIAQIRQAQDVLERRLVLENVSSYVRYRASSVTEWEFLAHVIAEADCELLLDINNVYVSSVNHGFSAEAYLDGLPAERVRQIHLAGHSRNGDHIIDTHDHPVAPAVWELYAHACKRFAHVATMIERDDNIPPLATLVQELDNARSIAAQTRAQAPPSAPPATEWVSSQAGAANLQATQRRWSSYILDPAAAIAPGDVDQGGPLTGARGMRIYHHAYRERLTEVLADSYPKCRCYLGGELFTEVARRYIEDHPPQERQLGRYGADFALLLRAAYPENVELSDLARLEWALRTVFDGADAHGWTLDEIGRQGAGSCLMQWPILHPSWQGHSLQSNAVAIWRAIDADEDVPEAERWEHPRALSVWRKGLRPHFRSLDPAEAQFLHALAREGATISSVAHSWSESGRLADPATLGGWLAAWWSDEVLWRDGAPVQAI